MIGNSGFKHHFDACEIKNKPKEEQKQLQEAQKNELVKIENKPLEPDLILSENQKNTKNDNGVVYVFDVLKDKTLLKPDENKKSIVKEALEVFLEHKEEIQTFLAPLVLAFVPLPTQKEEQKTEEW